jgi:putative transposase
VKYAWITKHRDSFPVAILCRVLDVSTSGYYESLVRPVSERAKRHERIQTAVRQVHAESHGTYGSHKIAQMVQRRDDLESACRNTVAAAMREMGLEGCVAKRFRPTTTQADPTRHAAENKLGQDFAAEAPNCKWVTDITYLPTAIGWVYLAAVVDLFSRKVVGWSIATSLATELVLELLRQRGDGAVLLVVEARVDQSPRVC